MVRADKARMRIPLWIHSIDDRPGEALQGVRCYAGKAQMALVWR